MNRMAWALAGGAAAIALMLACEMRPDIGPGGPASADETTARVIAITADTDPAQHVGGVTNGGKLADGPFFLTSAVPQCPTENAGNATFEFADAEGSNCTESFRHHMIGKTQLIGVRVLVPAGCALVATIGDSCGVTWSGFRPYE